MTFGSGDGPTIHALELTEDVSPDEDAIFLLAQIICKICVITG